MNEQLFNILCRCVQPVSKHAILVDKFDRNWYIGIHLVSLLFSYGRSMLWKCVERPRYGGGLTRHKYCKPYTGFIPDSLHFIWKYDVFWFEFLCTHSVMTFVFWINITFPTKNYVLILQALKIYNSMFLFLFHFMGKALIWL